MVIKLLTDADDVRNVLQRARKQSEDRLTTMRKAAADRFGNDSKIIVGVNGSVARREVTSGSDVDLFFLTVDGNIDTARRAQSEYRADLTALGIKMPAHGGVFEDPLAVADLLANIGGDKDTNEYLTRRMLYLLEGEWLQNQVGFERVRSQLIEHYVTEDLEERKLCRYLLNDVIRYWRTICIDFEEKTATGDKPRAIRLIKLRFARMMLYFGGVVAISKTADIPAPQKRAVLLTMFAKPPIERLVEVFGEQDTKAALNAYATFLHAIDDESVRSKLDLNGFSGLKTAEYDELVAVARDFRDGLENLLVDSGGLRQRIASALLL
jgi:hypothetical protein